MTNAVRTTKLLADLSIQAATGTYKQPDDAVFFADGRITDVGVRKRILIERLVIRTAVTDGIAEGLEVRVHDGCAWAGKRHGNVDAVMAEIMSTDNDDLYFYQDGEKLGWVKLIYGNDGWDVMNDYTTNLALILNRADTLGSDIGDVL